MTLPYPYEIRPYEIQNEKAVLEEILDLKLPEQRVDLAKTIINKMI